MVTERSSASSPLIRSGATGDDATEHEVNCVTLSTDIEIERDRVATTNESETVARHYLWSPHWSSRSATYSSFVLLQKERTDLVGTSNAGHVENKRSLTNIHTNTWEQITFKLYHYYIENVSDTLMRTELSTIMKNKRNSNKRQKYTCF